MPGQRIGSFVAAVFGLVYVWVNSAPLVTPVAWILRAIGVLVFVAITAAVAPWRRPGGTGGPSGAQRTFPRTFWLITVAEVLALFGGLAVLNGGLHHPEGGVAWVSVVVGVHFFPLGKLFHQPYFYLLGAAITACGVIGLVLTAISALTAAISTVGGVVPGALLLGFGWWGSRRTEQAAPSPAVPTP